MKKYIFSLVLTFIVGAGFAQEARFGFTASPTFGFANVDSSPSNAGSYSENSDGKTGIAYGALVDYDFNGQGRYFLHSGLMMHHTGYSIDYNQGGINPSQSVAKVNTNYIEVPAVLKLKTNDIGYLRYFGQFGLNNAFLIGQKIKEGVDAGDITKAKAVDIGLNIGAGVEYNISQETDAVAGLYYVNGFNNAFDSGLGSIKHNQLGVRLGVYF